MENPPTGPRRRLRRSAQNRILLGVCGGLGEYLDLDPTLVRLGFVAATFFWGLSIPLYLIFAIIMPREEQPVAEPREVVKENVQEIRTEVERLLNRLADIFRR
ncbi:MAG: PspC domain-containing protein [Chloroflexi bacterium]|nr:PspC domain-containing protein [Chloroflexota bacterium]